jgi:sulfatase modifying factor 1
MFLVLLSLLACDQAPPTASQQPPEAAAPRAGSVSIVARATPEGAPIPYETRSVPAGTYRIGSDPSDPGREDDEGPVQVTLTRGYKLGVGEVTQALWDQVMSANPSSQKDPALPVGQVSWQDAVLFANALSARDGLAPAYTIQGGDVTWDPASAGWRLPTEAEWEIAARGANLPAPEDASLQAAPWTRDTSGGTPRKPCQGSPNVLGLCDLLGNMQEWVWDRYAPYPGASATDPGGAATGASRVLRGGSWNHVAAQARPANRNRGLPSVRFVVNGVRLARNE